MKANGVLRKVKTIGMEDLSAGASRAAGVNDRIYILSLALALISLATANDNILGHVVRISQQSAYPDV